MTRTSTIVGRLVLLIAFLLFWEAAAGGFGLGLRIADVLFVSRPSLVATDMLAYASSGELLRDLIATLSEAFGGLVLGMVTGVAFGLLLGQFKPLYDLLDPYLVAFNSLPRPALAPLLILWFGLGMTSKVFLAWSLVFFIVFYNTIYGIRNIDPDLLRSIRVMGANRWQVLRIVVLPSVLSWIFAAFRTSVSFALIGAVVGEFVGSSAGLGYRSVIAAGLFDTNRVFSILFILMGLGTVLVYLSERVERYLLRWRPSGVS